MKNQHAVCANAPQPEAQVFRYVVRCRRTGLLFRWRSGFTETEIKNASVIDLIELNTVRYIYGRDEVAAEPYELIKHEC